MNKIKELLPKHIKYLLFVYLSGIIVFTIFRFILIIYEIEHVLKIEENMTSLITNSFIMGFRFDTVISGYILALPLLVLSIFSYFKIKDNIVFSIVNIYIILLYTVAFGINASDIPFFRQFFARLNMSAFMWSDTPGLVFTMVISEFSYWGFFIPFVILSIVFLILVTKKKKELNKSVDNKASKLYFLKLSLISLFFMAFLFLGVRGRISKRSPIRVGTAFFSKNTFINLISLNPTFTLIKSYLDSKKVINKKIQLMDSHLAIKNVRNYLSIDSSNFDSPIAREYKSKKKPIKANVVVILFESFSAKKMGRYNNPNHLTPFLDSLAKQSYTFDRIYSAGIHTHNGIYASMLGFPALKTKHLLKPVTMLSYQGVINILRDRDYETLFFTTIDSQFDNMGGFLIANGIKNVIEKKHYDSDKIIKNVGAPDHVMFDHSIKVFNEVYKSKKNFFAVMLTGSDHGPYAIPDYIDFKAKNMDIKNAIVEYVDWATKKFVTDAKKQEWFDNTIFVFTGDHGSILYPVYDMPISYHHIPLIIYSPKYLPQPQIINNIGNQIDIPVTIMGLLNQTFVNNSFGIDLMTEKRKFSFFSSDNKIACMNDSLYLIIRGKNNESLFKYKNKNTENFIDKYPDIVKEMKNYTYSMIQAAQWIVENNKVGKQVSSQAVQTKSVRTTSIVKPR